MVGKGLACPLSNAARNTVFQEVGRWTALRAWRSAGLRHRAYLDLGIIETKYGGANKHGVTNILCLMDAVDSPQFKSRGKLKPTETELELRQLIASRC